MPEPISKTQRWLDLIAYLIGRHFPVPVEELMERLPAYARDWRGGDEKARDSVRRKFERDKDELREDGVLLHRLGAKGAVKVIDNGKGVLFEGSLLLLCHGDIPGKGLILLSLRP